MFNKNNHKIMKIKTSIITNISLATIAIMIFACSGEKNTENKQEEADKIMEEIQQEEETTSAQKVFYALPSPFEVAMLIKNIRCQLLP